MKDKVNMIHADTTPKTFHFTQINFSSASRLINWGAVLENIVSKIKKFLSYFSFALIVNTIHKNYAWYRAVKIDRREAPKYEIQYQSALAYFRKSVIGPSRNIARFEVLADISNTASEELLESIKILGKEGFFSDMNISNVPPKKILNSGVCAGICWDIAETYLKGLKAGDTSTSLIEKIIKENQNGASARAVANQAIYEILKHKNFKLQKCMLFVLRELKYLYNYKNEFLGLDLFFKYLERIRLFNFENLKFQFQQDNNIIPFIIKDLSIFKEAVMKKLTENNKMLNPIDQSVLELTITVIQYIESSIKQKDRLSTSVWAKLKNIIHHLFFQDNNNVKNFDDLFSNITNLEHRKRFKVMLERDFFWHERHQVLFRVRGLAMQSIFQLTGLSLIYDNNEPYLELFKNLAPGFYQILFSTRTGSHAISYIKENNDRGSGYILDPNGVQIKCEYPYDTIINLNIILNFYPLPRDIDICKIVLESTSLD